MNKILLLYMLVIIINLHFILKLLISPEKIDRITLANMIIMILVHIIGIKKGVNKREILF